MLINVTTVEEWQALHGPAVTVEVRGRTYRLHESTASTNSAGDEESRRPPPTDPKTRLDLLKLYHQQRADDIAKAFKWLFQAGEEQIDNPGLLFNFPWHVEQYGPAPGPEGRDADGKMTVEGGLRQLSERRQYHLAKVADLTVAIQSLPSEVAKRQAEEMAKRSYEREKASRQEAFSKLHSITLE